VPFANPGFLKGEKEERNIIRTTRWWVCDWVPIFSFNSRLLRLLVRFFLLIIVLVD